MDPDRSVETYVFNKNSIDWIQLMPDCIRVKWTNEAVPDLFSKSRDPQQYYAALSAFRRLKGERH
jgi:hypothetical protein